MPAARTAPRPAQGRGGARGVRESQWRPVRVPCGRLEASGGSYGEAWVPPAGVGSMCEMAVRGPQR